MLRVVSFNVNGVRARGHQLQSLVEQYEPDIVGLQETKVQDSEFPQAVFDDLGYHVVYHGQKGHYGVALMSKLEPRDVVTGLVGDGEDAQRRLISASYPLSRGREIRVMNGYFPQGESRDHETKFPAKQKFYADVRQALVEECDPESLLVLMGDMNVAPVDQDIGIGADNKKRWLRAGKCSFLPEEREWLEAIGEWGLSDTFREMHPEVDDRFSWFDYRSKGFDRDPKRGLRIDLLLATKKLQKKLVEAGISYEIRGMEKPSDHCPIWADFDL